MPPNSLDSPLAGVPWMIREDALADLRHATRTMPRMADAPGPGRGPADVSVRDGVATIPVYGPILRHATPLNQFLTAILGGTTVDRLATQLRQAVADPGVRSILMAYDSPGGEASGIGEMAAMIRKANGIKPTAAYVEGACCSAAYYLASAAGEIHAAPMAVVGSIGVVIETVDDTEFGAKLGLRRIVVRSSQSPRKAADPATVEGLAEYQKLVDAMADVFVADVARYRSATPAKVKADFGGGEVLVGAAALKVGMVDRVGPMDDLHRKLAGPNRARLRVSPPATAALADPGNGANLPLSAAARHTATMQADKARYDAALAAARLQNEKYFGAPGPIPTTSRANPPAPPYAAALARHDAAAEAGRQQYENALAAARAQNEAVLGQPAGR